MATLPVYAELSRSCKHAFGWAEAMAQAAAGTAHGAPVTSEALFVGMALAHPGDEVDEVLATLETDTESFIATAFERPGAAARVAKAREALRSVVPIETEPPMTSNVRAIVDGAQGLWEEQHPDSPIDVPLAYLLGALLARKQCRAFRALMELAPDRLPEMAEVYPDFLKAEPRRSLRDFVLPVATRRSRPSLQMLADRPLTDYKLDRLGFGPYAEALAEIIDNRATATPLTIAITARWGAGKTSLAKLVERRLVTLPEEQRHPPHIFCWFNAWMHDDAPHLGAACAAEVAKTANAHRSLIRRVVAPLPTAMLNAHERWARRLWLAGIAALLALGAAASPARDLISTSDHESVLHQLQGLTGARIASVFGVLLVAFSAWTRLLAIGQSAAKFVDDPSSEAARGSMNEVHAQLGKIIHEATSRGRWRRRLAARVRRRPPVPGPRFILFVDDLERCRPPRAVEVCETVSQLIAHEEVVCVLIADMSTIAASAAIKYAGLEGRPLLTGDERLSARELNVAYGRQYLQKMVQIEFALPPARLDDIQAMLQGSVDGRTTGTDDPEPRAQRSGIHRAVAAARTIDPDSIAAGVGVAVGAAALLSVDAKGGFVSQPAAYLGPSIIFGGIAASVTRSVLGVVSVQSDETVHRDSTEIDHVIQERLSSAASEGPIDPEQVRQELMQSDAIKDKNSELVEIRFRRALTDDSPLQEQAQSEILAFLPPLPRSAKRMLNHLRILVNIAVAKDLFGGSPPLEAKHLGKWVVLSERWPELARELSQHPEEMGALEQCTDEHQLREKLATFAPDLEYSGALVEFMNAETKLGPVIARLVYVDPTARARVQVARDAVTASSPAL